MASSLPDVNVWLALAAEGHIHHATALGWFSLQPANSVAFCRATQMGLLRLLTNPTAMGRGPRTIVQAWEVYERLSFDPRIFFAADPDGVALTWRQLMTQQGVGPSAWTDAYLAAFSQRHSSSLVTFDAAFARWPALSLTLLSSSTKLARE